MNESNFGKILEKFADTLEKQNARTEAKLDVLCDLVAKLAEARIEAKKDREFDTKRMERIEENQKDQGTTLRAMGDTVLLMNERVNGNKNKWVQAVQFILTLSAAVISAVVITSVK